MLKKELESKLKKLINKVNSLTQKALDLDPCDEVTDVINELRIEFGLPTFKLGEFYPDITVNGKYISENTTIAGIKLSDGTYIPSDKFDHNGNWELN